MRSTRSLAGARFPTGSTVPSALTALALAAATLPACAAAQTISGTLMDLDSDRPIDLGLVMMFTEAGDSVAMTITDESGHFSLSSPEPGSFLLLASALGYRETPAGVFELGEDAQMSVEYRLAPEPLAIDEIIVSLDRPVLQHHLVRNGFVRRLQRGLGHFITPHDIEESPATATEDLLTHIPGVRVGTVRISRAVGNSGTTYPRPDLGQTVQIRSANSGWCTPTVYVDGVRSFYDTGGDTYAQALTLSTLAPLGTVDAIEVYRRPAEIPPEYSFGQSGVTRFDEGGGIEGCGVLVVWTRLGLAPGRSPLVAAASVPGVVAGSEESGVLPSVDRTGPAPEAGERIRTQIDPAVADRLGLTPTWEGTYLVTRGSDLVANHQGLGRAVAVPLAGVQVLQVERTRAPLYAFTRGAIAGGAFGVGMWQFLKILCRRGCDSGLGSAWFPASVTGVVVGVLVGAQGPGTHWVQADLPAEAPPAGVLLPAAPVRPPEPRAPGAP